jgi:hypothetical protein
MLAGIADVAVIAAETVLAEMVALATTAMSPVFSTRFVTAVALWSIAIQNGVFALSYASFSKKLLSASNVVGVDTVSVPLPAVEKLNGAVSTEA